MGRGGMFVGFWCESQKGKRPLGRTRHRWEATIKMALRETGWGGMDWISLAQDRHQWRDLVNKVMKFQVP
jgi:hypothetical protein